LESSSKNSSDCVGFISHNDNKLYTLENFTEILFKLVNSILDRHEDIRENFSHNAIEHKIHPLIVDLHFSEIKEKSSIIDSFFKSLLRELRVVGRYIVPYLIENFTPDFDFTIGRVNFQPYSWDNYVSVFVDQGYKKRKQDLLKKESLERTITSFRKQIGCIAWCEVSAGDSNKAEGKAYFLVEQAVGVLRLYNQNQNFGITGYYSSPTHTYIHLWNKESDALSTSADWKNSTVPVTLKQDRYKQLSENVGLKEISVILSKEENDRTPLENKILTSIHWLSEIQKHERDKSDNLIRLLIALESLLMESGLGEKKSTLAERLAFVSNSFKEGRIYTYYLVSRLYNTRNNIVHEGHADFNEEDLRIGIYLLSEALVTIVRNNSKYPDLKSWIARITDEKFSNSLEL